jgi:MoaA/NifB/PqqE/SkfB family radical SAM enzyme
MKHNKTKSATTHAGRPVDIVNSTFCIKPWLHSAITSGGTYRMCCECVFWRQDGPEYNYGKLAKEDGTYYQASVDSIESTRNAQILKDVRASMLRGEKHPECVYCWSNEAMSAWSTRIGYTQRYQHEIDTCIRHTSEDGTIETEKLPMRYFDVRLGNTCNLKCRMCSPTDSSLWLSDYMQLHPNEDRIHAYDVEFEIYKNEKNDDTTMIEAWNKESYVEDLIQHIPHMDRIYMTGGEPTVIPEYWKLLRLIIEQGYSKSISLDYNSNMFLIPKYAWDIWKEFKNVRMTMSIDGMGKVQEYIRAPSNWDTIKRNIYKFHDLAKNHSNIEAAIAPTITIYNVLHMPDLVKWYLEQNFNRNFDAVPTVHLCYGPPHLTPQVFPRNQKYLIVEKYNKLFDWADKNYEAKFANFIKEKYQTIVDFSLKEDTEDLPIDPNWPRSRKDRFLDYNKKLDAIRKESLEECIPELFEAIKHYDT